MSNPPTSSKPPTTPEVSFRPARREDYDLALELYLDGTKPLLAALCLWQEERVLARFKQGFKISQVQIIQCDGADVGWMQVSENAVQYHLHQLHIVAPYRNRRIGTGLIQALLDLARGRKKTVALNVVRGNRAASLYRRLGFRIVGGDAEKLQMRWEPQRK